MQQRLVALAVALVALVPTAAAAKRAEPRPVPPVVHGGVRYAFSPFSPIGRPKEGGAGMVVARDEKTNAVLWTLQVYEVQYDPKWEQDVQDVHIKSARIENGLLVVTSERNETYEVDVATRAVRKRASRSTAPGRCEKSCLSYAPAVVRLGGTMKRREFPGPPNYESVAKGDKPEVYWVLHFSKPVCVNGTKGNSVDVYRMQEEEVQIIVGADDWYDKFRHLVGKKVTVTGTLMGAVTGHHHTAVLIGASGLDPGP